MVFWRVLLFLLGCSFACADEAQPLSVERLAREAALVLHGQVESKTTRRDEAGRIITEVRVRVTECWKGAWEKPVVPLVHGGGVLGEVGARVTGQASYTPGEEVVLFLTPNGQGEFVTVGMSWGKFLVSTNSSGEKVASRSGSEGVAIPLEELRKQIRKNISHD